MSRRGTTGPTLLPPVPAALSRFSAATIHEASPHSRVLPPTIRPAWRGAKAVGFAFTVFQTGGRNGAIHRAIYEAPAGSVMVVATDAGSYGYWGELMTRASLVRGLAGLVIDGGVRDVSDMEKLRFPVFASAICPRGTTKSPGPDGALGEPVSLGDATVRTGDLVIGDGDGVVCVPPDDLDGLLSRAEAREAREQRIRNRLAAGARLVDLVLPPSHQSPAGADRTGPAP